MRIHDVHERVFAAPAPTVGQILDTLSSADDHLWPGTRWPPMRLDRPLRVGATGGHAFIRYHVIEYQPGLRALFQFDPPTPVEGHHRFEVEPVDDTHTVVRHVLEGRTRGFVNATRWALVISPLHDALIEDAFRCAQAWLAGTVPPPPDWTRRVRLLRSLTARRVRRRRQTS